MSWSIQDFHLLKILGQGKFSKVYLAAEKKSGLLVSLKMINKEEIIESSLVDQIIKEITIQRSLNHDNILKIYGYFQDQKTLYLILEYVPDGDLYNLIKKQGKQSESVGRKIMLQIIDCLNLLNKENVIHRDIKPENILIQKNKIKLADFGLANYLYQSKKLKRSTFCGTIDYISPEMIEKKGYDLKSDIWSIGILLFEICSGQAPFESNQSQETIKKIKKGNITYPNYFSEELKDLISQILQQDPSNRPSLESIQNHKWFKVEQ